MTFKDQVEISKTCTSKEEFVAKCDYRLGREAAMADIAAGTQELHASADFGMFGEAWIRGYREYISAWNVLNMA